MIDRIYFFPILIKILIIGPLLFTITKKEPFIILILLGGRHHSQILFVVLLNDRTDGGRLQINRADFIKVFEHFRQLSKWGWFYDVFLDLIVFRHISILLCKNINRDFFCISILCPFMVSRKLPGKFLRSSLWFMLFTFLDLLSLCLKYDFPFRYIILRIFILCSVTRGYFSVIFQVLFWLYFISIVFFIKSEICYYFSCLKFSYFFLYLFAYSLSF